MPPRAGKSYITSLFCAWMLGNYPSGSIMRNTCTSTLYQKFSYDVREIVKSIKFKEVFSGVRLSANKSNLGGWNTNKAKMVSYFGSGVGGTIIGFGATKVAITDDLYRGLEDAWSDTINDKIHTWMQGTHGSRMEKGCKRVDIGTRWSINDVIGKNIQEKKYDRSIIVPALTQDDKSFCEAVMSTEEYLKKRRDMLAEIWSAEYMQEPVDLKGRLFSGLKELTEEQFAKLEHLIEGYVGYIDVSDEGDDFTALAIGAIIGDKVYIVDYVYSDANTDVTIPMCAAALNRYGVNYCRVESNSMGAMFSRALQKLTKTKILSVPSSKNKLTRIIMQSAFIINDFVFVKRPGPMRVQFMDNVTMFSKKGKNKNDDAPDCLAGLAMFIKAMFRKNFE